MYSHGKYINTSVYNLKLQRKRYEVHQKKLREIKNKRFKGFSLKNKNTRNIQYRFQKERFNGNIRKKNRKQENITSQNKKFLDKLLDISGRKGPFNYNHSNKIWRNLMQTTIHNTNKTIKEQKKQNYKNLQLATNIINSKSQYVYNQLRKHQQDYAKYSQLCRKFKIREDGNIMLGLNVIDSYDLNPQYKAPKKLVPLSNRSQSQNRGMNGFPLRKSQRRSQSTRRSKKVKKTIKNKKIIKSTVLVTEDNTLEQKRTTVLVVEKVENIVQVQDEEEVVKEKVYEIGAVKTFVISPLSAEFDDADYFGKADPYFVVKVGEVTKKTEPQNSAGKNPKWKDVSFTYNNSKETEVKVEIWDDDTFSDDLIGRGEWVLPKNVKNLEQTVTVDLVRDDVVIGFAKFIFKLLVTSTATEEETVVIKTTTKTLKTTTVLEDGVEVEKVTVVEEEQPKEQQVVKVNAEDVADMDRPQFSDEKKKEDEVVVEEKPVVLVEEKAEKPEVVEEQPEVVEENPEVVEEKVEEEVEEEVVVEEEITRSFTVSPVSGQLKRDDGDQFSKTDPYFVVKVGEESQKTQPQENAGTHPDWTGQGYNFKFENVKETEITIELWDDDAMSDDLIGKGVYQIPKTTEKKDSKIRLDLLNNEEWVGFCIFNFRFD